MEKMRRILQERFGDPIGSYAGEAPAGVRSVDEIDEAESCSECGYMEVEGSCGCTHQNEAKKRGLWANMHARRKAGKRPKRPGEKGYPKDLDAARK